MKKSILLASTFTLAVALPVVLHSSKAFSAVPVQAKPNLPDTPEFDSNKYYRLTSLLLGKGKSLDIENDANNAVHLANSEDVTGQFWKIEKFSDGYYRLTTLFKGTGMSLDVINDGNNNKLILNKTADVTGQAWKIEKLSNGYYRLTTQFQGAGKSLDANDGLN